VARAYAYPALDSVVWRSSQRVPAVARILAFDQDAGLFAFVDTAGRPGRIDLRSGRVQRAPKLKLTSLSSADGYGIFGVAGRKVTRLTPADARPWSYTPPRAPREVFPQPDGALLVAAERENGTVVWRLHPPETTLLDSVVLPPTGRGIRTPVGDRVYFPVEGGLAGVQSRDLSTVPVIEFDTPVRSLAPTPSGDRLYVATDSSREVSVINRYDDAVEKTITLPGVVRDLRMDPLGRYVLARPARGDSAWVIAIGTDRVIGTVRTAWRADLPVIAPDGAVAVTTGDDVELLDGETLRRRETVEGGGRDFWHVFLWNGFRPQATAEEPVVASLEPAPSATSEGADSAPAAMDSAPVPQPSPPPPRPAEAPRTEPAGFVVQFAALRSEAAARAAAAPIEAGGERARVIATQTEGTPIYRVVLGPYPTRQEADRAGRSSGRDYWVYEDIP